MKPHLQEYDMELVTVTLPKDQWEVVVKAIDIACNKPEPKPDLVMYSRVLSVQKHKDGGYYAWVSNAYTQMPSCKNDNLKLIFDGETGKLKDAEVLKS